MKSQLSSTGFHLLALGTYAPRRHAQGELLNDFGHAHDAFAVSVFKNGRIDSRCFCEPPARFTRERDPRARFAYFKTYAPELAARALQNAADSGLDPGEIEAVITTNSTGFMLPGIAETLGEKHGIGSRRALRYNLSGQGCYAAVPAIELARSLVSSGRVGSAAVLCTEPSSCMFSGDTKDRSSIVAQLLFGEGAAAMVFSRQEGRASPLMPRFVDSETELGEGSLGHIAIEMNDCWDSAVGPKVPETGAAILPGVIGRLLERNHLSQQEIAHWIFHPGGRRVLDDCTAALSLSEDQMDVNYRILARYGNMQSCTVLFCLQEAIRSRSPRGGDHGVLVGIGPGVTVSAMLLRWA